MNETNKDDSFDTMDSPTLVVRSVFGGTLMGLANLVPGISGGTMLLAAGIYPRFIDALAEVTRLRFRFRSLLVLGCVGVAGRAQDDRAEQWLVESEVAEQVVELIKKTR